MGWSIQSVVCEIVWVVVVFFLQKDSTVDTVILKFLLSRNGLLVCPINAFVVECAHASLKDQLLVSVFDA